MGKFYIKEYDSVGVVINKFEIIPSEINKTGISRISIETENKQILLFKVYSDNTIEILNKPSVVNNFEYIHKL